ncbi:AAL093Cp [Eremothecium gossypii ATCC 10895]|uniref:AAL093Cp n=1 Tax=Eremothecium gossypii (strain ATCC 10895 / CBS 109.51 / FGSC 9923 / NRRL Y-1056) TaxID=284811 RepID=Q75F21_EREGS|nr:AAL093Cp [Eremothecium gossypii ATCC 10895]AAS50273.1 AAL093Cp [Eremothecium gossypii ATCC 10895]AEY94558.1 FAAL093Cp [Eremothecium gossypii FDAG1]
MRGMAAPKIHRLEESVFLRLRSQLSIVSVGAAVRELMQNSVDACCGRLEVSVDLDRWRVHVRDDGEGLNREELAKVGQWHYTSKLRRLEDLTATDTYGFRGEGLYMLSNISRVILLSKRAGMKHAALHRLPATDNALPRDSDDIRLLDGAHGTTVILEDLFYNLPIRRRMLARTPPHRLYDEIRADVLQLLLFCQTLQVSVLVIKNNQEKQIVRSGNLTQLTFPDTLMAVLMCCLGPVVAAKDLQYVSAKYQDIEVQGVISTVGVPSKDYQFIYINKRRYEDKRFIFGFNKLFRSARYKEDNMLAASTRGGQQAYSGYPVYLLVCKGPPSISDLLQNPSKVIENLEYGRVLQPLLCQVAKSFLRHYGHATVSFLDRKMTRNRLRAELPLPIQGKTDQDAPESSLHSGTDARHLLNGGINPVNQHPKRKKYNPPVASMNSSADATKILEHVAKIRTRNINVGLPVQKPVGSGSISSSLAFSDEHLSVDSIQLKDCIVINQIGNKFILLKLEPSRSRTTPLLLILDQHAADERVKLEAYTRDYLFTLLTAQPSFYTTPCSIAMDLTHTEADILLHYKREIEFWGFEICYKDEYTGPLYLKAIPTLFDAKKKNDVHYLKRALLQYAYDLKSLKKTKITSIEADGYVTKHLNEFAWWKYMNAIPTVFLEILNSKACRSAIMFGDKLNHDECLFLVRQLSTCNMPLRCAHGRPSVIPIADLKGLGSIVFESYIEDYRIT